MAKDQDFQVLGSLVRAPAYEQARECLHDEGQEEEHRSMVEGDRWFKHGPEFPTPTRHRVVAPPQGDPGAAQRPRAYDAARPGIFTRLKLGF